MNTTTTTKLTKKQEIINSLIISLNQLADAGVQYCQLEDLEFWYTDPNNHDQDLVLKLELYSQYGSTAVEDKIACKWLKDNGYMVKNDQYQLPSFRVNKWIIKTF